ncbi:MAG: hypothetical protein LUD81_05145 [Clostridiales bacterium]|nr:hypothetical protein [Clostridiales bacterium]
MEKKISEDELRELLKPVLSVGAYGEEDYIYWKQGSNFDCSLFLLSSVQKRERLSKIRLLQKSLFCCLDEACEDVFIVSQFCPFEEWTDYYSGWFDDCYQIKKNVFYKEAVKEANLSNIKLITTRVIDYNKNKILGEKLFRTNMEYLSHVCFCVPALGLAVQPTHHIELRLFGKNKGSQYKDFTKRLLSFSDNLAFSE